VEFFNMNKKVQLDAAIGNENMSSAHDGELVKRLLTPAEWGDVVGGDGYAQSGNYTQTSGNYTQSTGGDHTQSGGGNYEMTSPQKPKPTGIE
jgi:hypothetical protein